MSGGREATNEKLLSAHEGVGYDEVYPSRRDPNEDLTWSPTRELSAHSLTEGEEGYKEDKGKEGDEGEEGDEEEGGGDDDEEDESDEGRKKDNDRSVGWVDNSSTRPFILSSI